MGKSPLQTGENMNGMDDFSTGLVDEVLSDMAENFFGSRKRMDDLIERFGKLALELKGHLARVLVWAIRLEQVLPGPEGLAGLLRAVNAKAEALVPDGCAQHAAMTDVPPDIIPRALTSKGRYLKLVLQRYQSYQSEANIFMNGRHTAHPENSKRRILSLHYLQLERFAQRINESIDKMRSEMPVSCLIRYAQGFADPALADKERITGAHCPIPLEQDETSLDAEFAYHHIDMGSHGVFPVSELPPLPGVKARVRAYCRELYKHEKKSILELMDGLGSSGGGAGEGASTYR